MMGSMLVRRIRLGLTPGILLLVALVVTGCGSGSLTNTTSPRPSGTAASTPGRAPGTSAGLAGAVSKLDLISQDSCQTQPPEQVYPNCERFLAELRSAVGTVRNDAAGLPNAGTLRVTATNVLAAADAYDRDGCGGGPNAPGTANAGRCASDLGQVRAGLTALLEQTRGVGGG
jgi:hypothetical protein